MTKDEALQMCLEYIETDAHERKYVRHAIKAALANEALERKAENARELGLDYYVPCCTDKTCLKCKAALEAKDEPWEKFCDSNCVWSDHHPDCKLAQRTWLGLTQDELNMIGDRMIMWNSHSLADVYVAIEAKLKEKNT
jgi:hypothetical protein